YTLMNLEKFSQKENIQFTFKKLLIHIEDNRYKTELISFLEKVEHFSFPVEILNVYEELAKRFWKSHPYILEEQTDTHLVIGEYDVLGRKSASEVERAYQKSTHKQGFLVTVLDRFSEYKFLYSMEEIPFDIEKDSLREIIEEKQKIFTHIFICLHEDYIDLME